MRVMLDTNVLLSALVFGGKTQAVLEKLLLSNDEVWVSRYVENEFADKLREKWPEKAERLISVFRKLPIHFCESTEQMIGELRDKKDIPILSDALFQNMDVILTGDKDFLEAALDKPIIMSPKMLEEYWEKNR